MIWELDEPVESATHARVEQIQEGWRNPTIHLRVSFGTLDGDGEFQRNELLRTGEVRILPDEYDDFRRFQKGNTDTPDAVAERDNWRREDVCRYLDARGLWTRLF